MQLQQELVGSDIRPGVAPPSLLQRLQLMLQALVARHDPAQFLVLYSREPALRFDPPIVYGRADKAGPRAECLDAAVEVGVVCLERGALPAGSYLAAVRGPRRP